MRRLDSLASEALLYSSGAVVGTRKLLAAALLLAGLTGCNVFEARSGDLECSLASDCTAPRICELGYCVQGVDVIDADPLAIDADPPEPDADPDSPDAQILPDADPNSPDASGCNQGATLGFTDDFDNNSVDARWNVTASGSAAAAEVNGRIEFSFGSGQPNHSAKFQTRDPRFDLTGLRAFVEVPLVIDTEGQTRIRLLQDGSHFLGIRVNTNGVLQARLNNASGVENLNTVVYNAGQMRWWQIREAGAQVHYEVSSDGMSWTTVASTPTPAFVNDVQVQLQAISTATNGSSGNAHYDNFNVLPACP